ncbi:mediator of RNA polymerase II transcription subunit 27-A-like [Ylistrum balloti]|uniref:mediator of RNA polymerase II transcription subunit 27-A-like n=1 Tax=Ylistrum balloti TaxID=509963 RepID=UPI002905D8CE|nr:mediator of RNA polymerase II transcription subunit 27-A-like [Ylistrum balloti]
MADTEVERLTQAICLTQKLRTSVTRVFSDLSDGYHISQGNEKASLNDLQKALLNVNDNYSDLEKLVPNLNSVNITAPNSALPGIDPVYDKTAIYSQITHAHKWTNKVHKLADYASAILSPSQLKRTHQGGQPLAIKRQRKTPHAHAIPPPGVDQCISALERIWSDMTITLSRPMGNCAVLQIALSRTLRALIVLRGLLIESVIVKAYSEDFLTTDGKVDLWSRSRYQVFNKVTDMVTAATLHFCHPQMPDLSLRSFLLWFNSYKTLFSAPCQKCGKHLQGAFPPVWRELRTATPQHDGCRQT